MICPNCKCEYIRGVTECVDCGVALVDTLDSVDVTTPDSSGVLSIWQGDDPGQSAFVKEALEQAGIPVIDQESGGHFVFPSLRPRAEIYISSANLEKARRVLLDAGAWDDPDAMTEEERESLALPESDGLDIIDTEHPSLDPVSSDHNSSDHRLSDHWYEEEQVVEVWNGDSEYTADNLTVCLREVGIDSHIFSGSGRCVLVVRSQMETQAREIVREVMEASPPE